MNIFTLIIRKVRDIVGLPSLQEVLPGVYAGDFGDARRVDALRAHGITKVLNVACEIYDPNLTSDGIIQRKADLVDWDDPDNEARVQAAMHTLDQWYGNPPQLTPVGNILVHCEGGRNRTLYVLARWWARRTGRDWLAVAKEIQDKRPEMALHDWMLKQMNGKRW